VLTKTKGTGNKVVGFSPLLVPMPVIRSKVRAFSCEYTFETTSYALYKSNGWKDSRQTTYLKYTIAKRSQRTPSPRRRRNYDVPQSLYPCANRHSAASYKLNLQQQSCEKLKSGLSFSFNFPQPQRLNSG
jgi:hypothetical protein